jgi:hypothetical protein
LSVQITGTLGLKYDGVPQPGESWNRGIQRNDGADGRVNGRSLDPKARKAPHGRINLRGFLRGFVPNKSTAITPGGGAGEYSGATGDAAESRHFVLVPERG